MTDSVLRWRGMWQQLGAARVDPTLHKELASRYAEPHRKYHTLRHLEECFAHFDGARALAEHAPEVELGLWFHDAIYEVKRDDNEARSAAWARRSALEAGVPADACERVHALVMATRHQALAQGGDAQLLVDVDLSILGAAPQRFDEYERQIREEYTWVPAFLFRRKRAAILEEFLARPSIFSTGHFRERFEEQARANLERSLRALKTKPARA